MIKDKLTSQLLCVLIYIVSFYVSYIFTPQSIGSIWLKILIWHLYATLFIYLGSVILNNSSLYDPFWSVAPVQIVIYLAVINKNGLWIKDVVDDQVSIVNSSKVNNNFLTNTFITTFDKEFNLVESISSNKIDIKNNEWLIYDATIFKNNVSKKVDLIKFRSNFNQKRI